MTNKRSKEIPDTRGRPRKTKTTDMANKVAKAYNANKLPVYFKCATFNPLLIRRELHRFRCSFAMKDLQNILDIRFRMMPTKTGFVVTLRK